MSMAPSGDAAIKSFTAPGDVFACVESPLGDGVTTFTSEAIEPAVVERVEYAWIESLAAYHIEWQRAMTTAFAFLARAKIRRERDLLMLTAEQLYGSFVEIRADSCSTDSTYPYHSDLLPERMTGKQAIFDYWKGAPEMFDSIVEMRVVMGR
jgi:hypothetical protein